MENGAQNGVHSNHDRDPQMNGINGTAAGNSRSSPDKGKGIVDAPLGMNGGYDGAMDGDDAYQNGTGAAQAATNLHRMQDLPEEIQHITADIIPLNFLLSRLAQASHNGLQDLVVRLAAKPLPQAVANGSSDYRSTNAEDASPESRDKKKDILDFVKDLHNKWVKALVITEWSKKSDEVGLLIDIRNHLLVHFDLYVANLSDAITVKRELHWARVPSPDLKTALEVLAKGEVSFMPDLGYLDPPPLTPEEKLKWIDEIDTLLSVRLSLEDRENFPPPFREYTIHSGRVTFRSESEFEVDLTIADEDFDKQFWFLDFRFLFTPAVSELPDHVRGYLEAKVNDALAADGLTGCYKVLHEFVLTHKITELCRQAIELSRLKWIETLKVERLNRAMAIQYWASRPPPNGPQSWVIIGVHTGANADTAQDAWSTSYISLRWFRDGKEVKDVDIAFKTEEISAETLLKTVIARHVEHILSSFHEKLLSKPRFSARQAKMQLHISKDDPADSALVVQVFDQAEVTVKVDPMTGVFLLSPMSHLVQEGQRKLNASLNPVEEVLVTYEKLRLYVTVHELHQRGQSVGWSVVRPPVKAEELKAIVQSREPFQPIWLKRCGWNPQWLVLLSLSLAGDRWWLIELAPGQANTPGRVKMSTRLPLTPGQPALSDDFFQHLTVFVTGLITQITDLRLLRDKRIKHVPRRTPNYLLPRQIKLPVVHVRLSDLLVPQVERGVRRAWAKDLVMLSFRGMQDALGRKAPGRSQDGAPQSALVGVVAFARLFVTDKSKFRLLGGRIDRDMTYDPRAGHFSLRLRGEIGASLIELLVVRLRALDRLVDFLDAITYGSKGIVPRSVSLRRITFSYACGPSETAPGLTCAFQDARSWTVCLDLAPDKDISLTLEPGNPHVRVLDFLTWMANCHFEQLPRYLLRTLPLFRALDKLQESWTKVAASGPGCVEIFTKSPESMALRYTLPFPPNIRRQLNLEIKPKQRRGEVVWHMWRTDIDRSPNGNPFPPSSRNPNDEFSRVLHQRVWGTSGFGWTGLETGAAADTDGGIAQLLGAVDAAVRSLKSASSMMQQQQQQQQQQQAAAITGSQGSSTAGTQRHSQQLQTASQGLNGMRPGVKSASTPATAVVLD